MISIAPITGHRLLRLQVRSKRLCCCALQERVSASSSHAEQASQDSDEDKQQLKLRVQVIPSIDKVELTPAASRG